LEQLADSGECRNLSEIALLKDGAPAGLQCFLNPLDFFLRQENRHELVAALADLLADLLETDFMAGVLKGENLGLCMQIHEIDECAVYAEDYGLRCDLR
jgi:hypothetical protein